MNFIKCYALLLLFFITTIGNSTQIHDLVDIQKIISTIHIEVYYATKKNFTGQQIYPVEKCYVHKDVANALSKVQNELNRQGLGLKIWDGYRPLFAQWKLWSIVPDERYVSDPVKGGRHTRGTAVDVTLVF